MKSQLARLQQTLSTQSELIQSMVQEMDVIRQEMGMCRDVTEFMLSVILSGSDTRKTLMDQPIPASRSTGYHGLNPSRLP
jgi:hypothetical protein